MKDKSERKTNQLQSRFTDSELAKIEAKASEEGRTISNLIHTVIMEYVNSDQE